MSVCLKQPYTPQQCYTEDVLVTIDTAKLDKVRESYNSKPLREFSAKYPSTYQNLVDSGADFSSPDKVDWLKAIDQGLRNDEPLAYFLDLAKARYQTKEALRWS